MGKFVIKKKIDLSHYGEDWKDSYLIFKSLSYKDSLSLSDFKKDEDKLKSGDSETIQRTSSTMMELLQKNFVSGKAPGEDGLVDISAQDLPEMPVEILHLVIEQFSRGKLDPKVEAPSGTQST